MVTKSKSTGRKKGKVKVGKMKLKKETVKDLSAEEQEKVKGGRIIITNLQCTITCNSVFRCT